MGIYDSSKTRVTPIFDELLARDVTGRSWLQQLISLTESVNNSNEIVIQENLALINWGWANTEIPLAPPKSLLCWLIKNLSPPKDNKLGSSPTTREKRRALLRQDSTMVKEALELLEKLRLPSRAWYILEGPTKPDVYLETSEIIVVIEGKRTESGPTTSTTWMPIRHQILRHIECAWEIRGKRKVVGFFIVEGDGGADATEVPENWLTTSHTTINQEVLEQSLPHRSEEERHDIAKCFFGVTTWQKVCKEFGIDWDELPVRIS